MTATEPAYTWWVAHCKIHYPDLQSDEQIFARLLTEFASVVQKQA